MIVKFCGLIPGSVSEDRIPENQEVTQLILHRTALLRFFAAGAHADPITSFITQKKKERNNLKMNWDHKDNEDEYIFKCKEALKADEQKELMMCVRGKVIFRGHK